MNNSILFDVISCYRQNYIIANNTYFFTGFILYHPTWYSLLECDHIEVDRQQIRSNLSLVDKAKVKSVMNIALQESIVPFLKSDNTKEIIETQYNTFNISYNTLDIYKLNDLLKTTQVSKIFMQGRKFNTLHFNLVSDNMIVECRRDPFAFCKNQLTSTIADIKQNSQIMNEIDVNNYYNVLNKFDIIQNPVSLKIAESQLPKLKQISRVKFKTETITDNEFNSIKNIISWITKNAKPHRSFNFEYKLTFRGLTLIISTWERESNNGLMLPGIKKRIKLNSYNLDIFLQYLKSINSLNSLINKLESIKLTLT